MFESDSYSFLPPACLPASTTKTILPCFLSPSLTPLRKDLNYANTRGAMRLRGEGEETGESRPPPSAVLFCRATVKKKLMSGSVVPEREKRGR